MLVSGVQQSGSNIYIFFFRFFSIIGYYKVFNISLCYTVGLCFIFAWHSSLPVTFLTCTALSLPIYLSIYHLSISSLCYLFLCLSSLWVKLPRRGLLCCSLQCPHVLATPATWQVLRNCLLNGWVSAPCVVEHNQAVGTGHGQQSLSPASPRSLGGREPAEILLCGEGAGMGSGEGAASE